MVPGGSGSVRRACDGARRITGFARTSTRCTRPARPAATMVRGDASGRQRLHPAVCPGPARCRGRRLAPGERGPAGSALSAEPIIRSRGVLGNAANLTIRRVSTLGDSDSDRALRSRGRRSGSPGPGRPGTGRRSGSPIRVPGPRAPRHTEGDASERRRVPSSAWPGAAARQGFGARPVGRAVRSRPS
jgi:hypothetical protein